MNHEAIAAHLIQQGYNAYLTDDGNELFVESRIGELTVTLKHEFPEVIRRMPQFLLVNRSKYGTLAHVEPYNNTDLGKICVHDPDSISVNFNVPTLAYEGSLERHLCLLEKLVTCPNWNHEELLREFRSHWELFCQHTNTFKPCLYLACDPTVGSLVQIKRPIRKQQKGVGAHYLGLGRSQYTEHTFGIFRNTLKWDTRTLAGKALVLQLRLLEPAPYDQENFAEWYEQCVENLEPESATDLENLRRENSKEFWLVFTGKVNAEQMRIWFAIRFYRKNKKKYKIPITASECAGWQMRPVPVRGLDRESIVPRSGGQVSLAQMSVLLIGCGSVGSEMAHRLASTGLGELMLSDPDIFCEDNLYRHSLSIFDIELLKSSSLTVDLQRKYPWIHANNDTRRLEQFANLEELNHFDLIIIAIGSPTIERQFQEFVTNPKSIVDTPVMNVWLEAYGIGGHATLAVPGSKGCLFCAYVDNKEFTRGLSSNLNFLAPNQNFAASHGGCGNLFLPYNAIASNYTATMAADLASRYLLGEIQISSKVSWKGNSGEARKRGFRLTYRYDQFNDNLNILPLLHPECDFCGE